MGVAMGSCPWPLLANSTIFGDRRLDPTATLGLGVAMGSLTWPLLDKPTMSGNPILWLYFAVTTAEVVQSEVSFEKASLTFTWYT